MSKVYRSVVSLLVCLCFTSLALFSSTLHVNAATSYYDLSGSSPVAENTQSVTLTFDVEPTFNYEKINGGTYSGTGSSSQTGTATVNANVSVGGTISQSGTVSSTSGSYSGTVSTGTFPSERGTLSINSTSASMSGYSTLTGSLSSGTVGNMELSSSSTGSISISSTTGGSMRTHFRIPYYVFLPFQSGQSIEPNKYYGFTAFISNISLPSQNDSIKNIYITDNDGRMIYNYDREVSNCKFVLGSEVLGRTSDKLCVPIFFEFDYFIPLMTGTSTSVYSQSISFNLKPIFRIVREEQQSYVGSVQSDPIQHDLQKENNEITEDTNETTHSIFDSITDFFGSFFDNLIHVFVPEDGYFTEWFNRLNQLLTDKLGILYYPFGYTISFFTELSDRLNNFNESTAYITFPEIKFNNPVTGDSYVIIQQTVISLNDFNFNLGSSANSSLIGTSGFNTLRTVCRSVTSFVMIFWLLSLLRKKLNLILRGENNDN